MLDVTFQVRKIRIKPWYQDSDHLLTSSLTNESGELTDSTFCQIFNEGFSTLSLPPSVEEWQEQITEAADGTEIKQIVKGIFQCTSPQIQEIENNIFISGRVLRVDTAGSGVITNLDSGESYPLTDNDINSRPYFYMLCCSRDRTYGLLYVEKHSTHSVLERIESHIRKTLQASFHRYSFKSDAYLAEGLVQALVDSNPIKKIQLEKHKRQFDQADHNETFAGNFTIEQKITLKPNNPLHIVANLYGQITQGQRRAANSNESKPYYVVPGVDGDYDDIVMTFDLDGKSVSFKYSDPNANFRGEYVIRELIGTDGIPDYQNLITSVKEHYNLFRSNT